MTTWSTDTGALEFAVHGYAKGGVTPPQDPAPRKPEPLQMTLWTDRPGYGAGDTVRLYRTLFPHDDRGRNRTFVYLERPGGGERRWLALPCSHKISRTRAYG